MTNQKSTDLTTKQAKELLSAADNILILTHANPDGDTAGSSAALCMILRKIGKTAFIHNNSTITEKYIPFVEEFLVPQDFTPSYIVAVDIADTALLSPDASHLADSIDLCIDHHRSNKLYAKNTLLDAGSSACGMIIFSLCHEFNIELTAEIALPLYLAISTDTGCFRYSNTTPETLRVAADLLETNINFTEINERFFETKSRSRFALESNLFEAVSYFDNNTIAFSVISLQMVDELGLIEDDTDNISSFLRTIDGVDVGASFRERSNNLWKISVRTSGADNASKICSALGGGGHLRAAGCTFTGNIEDAFEALLNSIYTERKKHD